jgi:hypothetical protein
MSHEGVRHNTSTGAWATKYVPGVASQDVLWLQLDIKG